MKKVIDEVGIQLGLRFRTPLSCSWRTTIRGVLPVLQLHSVRCVPKPKLTSHDLVVAVTNESEPCFVLALITELHPLFAESCVARDATGTCKFLLRIRRVPLAGQSL